MGATGSCSGFSAATTNHLNPRAQVHPSLARVNRFDASGRAPSDRLGFGTTERPGLALRRSVAECANVTTGAGS